MNNVMNSAIFLFLDLRRSTGLFWNCRVAFGLHLNFSYLERFGNNIDGSEIMKAVKRV